MNQSRAIKTFIFSQYFSDGLRASLGILLPPLLLAQLGHLHIGIAISLGTFCANMADNPGPISHKRKGMLVCNLLMFVTALLTGLINKNPYLVGLEIVVLCFLYSMLSVYGSRASSIGTAALLIMVLTIDEHHSTRETLENTLYIFIGGVWYMLLSLFISRMGPFRSAQQALGECIKEMSDYIRLKAEFYNTNSDYDENYKKLISQQVIIHQQQNAIRELLFTSRAVAKDSTQIGRTLVLTFIDTVDLFEQTMATYYDYHTIKKRYEKAEVLEEFHKILVRLADEFENLSHYIIRNEKPIVQYDFSADLELLKSTIDRVETDFGINNLVLKKILINIRNMSNRIRNMYHYFDQKQPINVNIQSDLSKFAPYQDFDLRSLKNNLNFGSSIFRHSLRVAIVCLMGYLVSMLFPLGHHSYWILLTILIIMKPDLSLTKKRNYQRLVGTIIGGIAGTLLLTYIKDQTALFAFLLFFMIGAHSFYRLNYIVYVLFLTPYILIAFSFLGANSMNVAEDRIVGTLVGAIIAITSSYVILPNWEYYHLKDFLKGALVANYNYFLKVTNGLNGQPSDVITYKLARKDMYVSSANLGGAFQRMLSEPKSKQLHVKELHKFVVLNHMLSSYISTLAHRPHSINNTSIRANHIKMIRKSLNGLIEMIRQFPPPHVTPFKEYGRKENVSPEIQEEDHESKILTEQLESVNQLIKDLSKINKQLLH